MAVVRMFVVVLLVACAGCLRWEPLQCASGLACPSGTQCDDVHDLCVTDEQLTGCAGLPDGQLCRFGASVGVCDREVCIASDCGNGQTDPGEACDDGTITGGDGCSADCKKLEMCGDAIVDDGETCDDQNTNPADGCDSCVATTWRATPIIGGIGDAASTGINDLAGVAVDPSGNVYVVDTGERRVRKIDLATGLVTTFAGGALGGPNGSGDGGPASGAALSLIVGGIATDLVGNVYIADTYGHKIRRVDPSGIITTFAGGGISLGDGGPATAAQLAYPQSVAADDFGNVYIADTYQHRVRRVHPDGRIFTIAGTGTAGNAANQLSSPADIAVDLAGNVYIADTGNNRIQRVTQSSIISTVVGGSGGSADGIASNTATLCLPRAISVDASNALLLADGCTSRIRRAVIGGAISTVVNTTNAADGFSGDGGPATLAKLSAPMDLTTGPDGSLWIADLGNRRVRRVDPAGTISTVVGNGVRGFIGNGSLATSARVLEPQAIALDAVGGMYIADSQHNQIRRVGADGLITAIAGRGTPGFAGDSAAAVDALLDLPTGLALAPGGVLYIADTRNHRIRRVDAGGTITTIAGTGTPGLSGDTGPASAAQLWSPRGVAVDANGNLYIADTDNHRVRKVDSAGTITTVAGTTIGLSGDDGPATSAQLNSPYGVTMAGTTLYIADRNNDRIRRVESGTITTVAGTTYGFSGDGMSATAAQLSAPSSVAVDGQGRLYIGDSGNSRVRRVDGTTIDTICGAGFANVELDLGDGDASSAAKIGSIGDIAVDGAGNVFTSDPYHHRVRRCTPGSTISTVAGLIDPERMGPLGQARLAEPRAVVVSPSETFVAGGATGTLQRIQGTPPRLTTVAGRYPAFGTVDNRARYRSLGFGTIGGVAFDVERGIVFIAETTSGAIHTITMVDPADPSTWTIGPLANAQAPTGLYYDAATKELYVAETGVHVISAFDLSAGTATPPRRVVAGFLGSRGFAGDNGVPTAARLNAPRAITRCSNGDLFIADTGNHRIRRIAGGRITTVLGTGESASSSDGAPATAVPIATPTGLACDPAGNLIVTSTTTVRLAIADAAGVVDGTGPVKTIYGIVRTAFPERVTACLTGVASVEPTKLWVTDACSGLMIELVRGPAN